MSNQVYISQDANEVNLVNTDKQIVITEISNGTSVNITQPITSVISVASLGPQGQVGPPGLSPIGFYSQQQSEALTNYTQKLNITAVGTYAMAVSASGMHIVDLTGLASPTSASLNITLHPESFTTVGQQAGIVFTYSSGSGTAVAYRTLVSASAGYGYFSPNTGIGISTSTFIRQGGSNRRDFGSNTANPTIMTLTTDGIYLGASALPINPVQNDFAGSHGTPL